MPSSGGGTGAVTAALIGALRAGQATGGRDSPTHTPGERGERVQPCTADTLTRHERLRTMNVLEKELRRVDAFQQRHTPLAVVFGVVKKFGDDNAGVLVGSLAFTAFGAVFPLLLLLVTILGVVLGTHSGLRADVMNSTLKEFPIIGQHLGNNIKAIHRNSTVGLIVGVLGLTWGSLGLAQNGIFTMEQVWNLPGPDRPNYIKRLGRSLSFLVVLGVGMLVSTVLAAGAPTANGPLVLTVAGALASLVVNFAEYLFAFRVLTPHRVSLRQLMPGAILGGVAWTIMQSLGGFIVGHYLKNDSAVYGLFAIVLGLFAWILPDHRGDGLRRRAERGAGPALVAPVPGPTPPHRRRPPVSLSPSRDEPAPPRAEGRCQLRGRR